MIKKCMMMKIRICRKRKTDADTIGNRNVWTEHHIDRKPVIIEDSFEIIVIRSTWEKENIDIFWGILVQNNAFKKSKDVRKKVLIASIRETIKYKLGKE